MNLHWRFIIWTHILFLVAPALSKLSVKKKMAPIESTGVLVDDGKIRHPADVTEWQRLEDKYIKFNFNLKNVWFDLIVDG